MNLPAYTPQDSRGPDSPPVYVGCVVIQRAVHRAVLTLILLSVTIHSLLASIPGELLGETKLSNVPGQGFGSSMLAVQGDTLVAKTNVYVRIGANWVVQDQLAIVDPVTPSPFPVSAAIDPSEATLVVGTRDGDGGKGAAYVFVKEGNSWTQQAMLRPAEAAAGDMAGYGVAIEGEWIVVGAPQGTLLSSQAIGSGSAYIFRNVGGTWTQVKRLVAGDGDVADWFGENIAISGDLIVVGAPGNSNAEGSGNGAAYVFERNAGGPDQWGQTAKLIPPKRTFVHELNAGRAVDVSRDVVVLGSEEGSFVYRRRPNGTWILEGDSLRHSSVDSLTQVNSIGLNDAADSFVAGDFQPDGQTGVAYLFDWTGTEWVEAGLIKASDGGGQFFGWALGVSGETIAVNDSFGNVYVYAPDYADEALVAGYVRKSLYYEDADNTPAFPRSDAAFRYKTLLFAEDDADPERRVRARIEEIGSLYGDNERARAQAAENRVRLALEAVPGSVAYGNLLLDIHYDRTAAEALFVKDALAKADLARLGPPSTAGGFVIDDEIAWYESTLTICVSALRPYLTLLNDALGHPQIDPPLGYQIIQNEVPNRGLMPATYLDATGDPQPVILDDGPLFNGFKDLVLLFDLLRDHGRASASLSQLRWARDESGDRSLARQQVGDGLRFLQLHRDLLLGIFAGNLPPENDPSGLAQAIAGVEQTVTDLNELRQLFHGDQNVLGFDENFLMLVQQFQDLPQFFDSFNSIKAWMDPAFSSRQLGYALERLGGARGSYSEFRGNQDEIREQFEGSTITFDFRLFEIVGANRGQPGYDQPGSIAGSELWQQIESIKAAQLNIRRNQVNIANLWAQMQIEINRANSMADAYIRHGNAQAELTEYVGHINAVQAASQALTDGLAIDKLFTGAVFGIGANAAIQGAGEELKGQIEAEKERLAGLHSAEIVGIESRAIVKTLLLEMNTLAVESQEAALLLRQELGRLAALHREKANLERRIDERNVDLASRFFADPVHRVQSLHDTVEAHVSFADAQKWIFFMARALDYKWNTPFVRSSGGRLWSTGTVFKLRNAEELQRMYQIMVDHDGLIEGTRRKDDFFDWFSVREDFLGFRRVNDQGVPLSYRDPETGGELDAITAFRRHLERHTDTLGQIRIEFSTVRELPGGTFFRGARLLPNGQVDPEQRGLYLDKIRWLKIRLPGNHNPNRNRSFITGALTYSGTSYIRNEAPGQRHPDRPDRVVDEWTPYSTRYWFQASTRPDRPPVWQFREAFSAPAQMWLTNDPRQEGSAAQIDVLPSVQQIDSFKERSVATSEWRMIIPTVDGGATLLDIDELDDIEIYFYHYAVIRP